MTPYRNSCVICQRVEKPNQCMKADLLQLILVVDESFKRIVIDCIGEVNNIY